jgi:hypothetical protein
METFTMTCWTRFGTPLLLFVLFVPFSASAQTISGTVTDTSGAIVPGVTVEASSPALIERVRVVTTNEAGRYTIVNLRPGVYTVTFTLTGFRGVRREGIELISDFTAQVNAQLGVSGVEEVITVAAAAPAVDVQGVSTPTIVTRETMDALPTGGRTPADLMQTVPGVTPGFFGSQFRGTQDSLTMVDGMRATLMIGAGPSLTTAPTSNNMYQEFSFSTAIDSAEMGQPGMRINLVPRDGGNQFSGTIYTNYPNDSWQSSNIDNELRAQGLTEPPKTLKSFDFNPTFGGPIVRDGLWFQSTYQYNEGKTQVFGSFFDADDSPFSYRPDPTRPGVNSNEANSFVQRLTWQATPKDKVAGFYEWNDATTPYFYSALLFVTPPPEATLELNSPNDQQVGVRWTRTHTSRLLFETSLLRAKGTILNDYRGSAAGWSARYVDQGLPTTRPNEYAILDINTNRLIGLANVSDANISHSMEVRGTASYVTGSHSMKAGFSFFNGSYHRPTSVIGHVVMRYSGGFPQQVDLTLPGNEREEIDADWGLFVQDRWTTGRLTVNGGLRLDVLKSSVPEQVLPASPWLGEQRYGAQDVLDYKDLSPRVGAAYDLFGNGKTAVKVALARYVGGETVNLTGAANPIRLIATTDRRTWLDVNGDRTIFNPDFSVQTNELGPSTNLNFGTAVPGTVYDPDALGGWFHRAYSWETNVSVQHEVIPRVGVTALFYRRSQGNQRTNDNLRISPSSFDGPFCVTSPIDARLPGGGGQQICGLYDLKSSALGQVSNYNTFATNLGTGAGFKDVVTGYEFSLSARLPRGTFLQGGLNFQRVFTNAQRGGGFFGGPTFNTCDVIDNPEVLFCENESAFVPDFSLNGSYILPLDIQVSGIYQGIAGPNIQATWNAPAGAIIPGLGRPLSAGLFATKAIALVEPNKEYVSMRHIFDLRFAKLFRLQRLRFQVMGDLYNIFNSNAVTAINTTYGASFFSPVNNWLLPTNVASPRQFRLGAQFDF